MFQYRMASLFSDGSETYDVYFGHVVNGSRRRVTSRELYDNWEVKSFDPKLNKFTDWTPCRVIEDEQLTNEQLNLEP